MSSALLLLSAFEAVALGIAARRGVSRSRRALAVALVLMLPGLGLPLAIIVRRMRGTGGVLKEPARKPPPRELTREDVLALADQPGALDRLMSLRPEERLDALVSLASANDANAVTLLRWTVQHGPREAVLEAALTLEELDLQRARVLEEAERAFEESPSFDTAIAAGDAALTGILNGLADRATVPALADRARTWYRFAEKADPRRARAVGKRLALLESDPLSAEQPVEVAPAVAQRRYSSNP